MDPRTKKYLDSMETNAFTMSKIGEVAVSRCIEGFDGNDISESEQECIKTYTAKLVQTVYHTDLYRYADRGRPAKEA
jgi:hypothetical protein